MLSALFSAILLATTLSSSTHAVPMKERRATNSLETVVYTTVVTTVVDVPVTAAATPSALVSASYNYTMPAVRTGSMNSTNSTSTYYMQPYPMSYATYSDDSSSSTVMESSTMTSTPESYSMTYLSKPMYSRKSKPTGSYSFNHATHYGKSSSMTGSYSSYPTMKANSTYSMKPYPMSYASYSDDSTSSTMESSTGTPTMTSSGFMTMSKVSSSSATAPTPETIAQIIAGYAAQLESEINADVFMEARNAAVELFCFAPQKLDTSTSPYTCV